MYRPVDYRYPYSSLEGVERDKGRNLGGTGISSFVIDKGIYDGLPIFNRFLVVRYNHLSGKRSNWLKLGYRR